MGWVSLGFALAFLDIKRIYSHYLFIGDILYVKNTNKKLKMFELYDFHYKNVN